MSDSFVAVAACRRMVVVAAVGDARGCGLRPGAESAPGRVRLVALRRSRQQWEDAHHGPIRLTGEHQRLVGLEARDGLSSALLAEMRTR